MVQISDVQKLREVTGAGVMDCKRALADAGGDFDRAASLIRERGFIKAEKKAERGTGAGLLESYIHNNRIGVLLELRCETDFVARTDEFKTLAHELAMQVAAMDPADVKTLMSQPYFRDETTTTENVLKGVIAKVGENIAVARFCRYEL